MEAQIMANAGVCTEFMKDDNAEKAEISVFIAPIKLVDDSQTGKVQVISGCNFWKSCHNIDCWYSIAARQKTKTEVRK